MEALPLHFIRPLWLLLLPIAAVEAEEQRRRITDHTGSPRPTEETGEHGARDTGRPQRLAAAQDHAASGRYGARQTSRHGDVAKGL